MFEKLITWSKENFNHLPWRNNRTPYTTLVSEIMLQQTTVATVLNHFQRFCKKYSNYIALADATDEELAIEWKGLGYYRRARNLKSAAITIEKDHNSQMPATYSELIAIKGVGEYTANAILAIGLNQEALAIDANLERVLARIYALNSLKGPKLQKEIKEKFVKGEIIKERSKKWDFRELNEALMDLGREFCKANKVYCELCPMKDHCLSFQDGVPLEYPKRSSESKKKKKFYELKLVRLIIKKDNKLLVYKKNQNEWLSGQYEIPTFILSSEDESLNQYPYFKGEAHESNELKKLLAKESLKTIKTSITKYKIENKILEMSFKEFKDLSSGCGEEDLDRYLWIENSTKSNLSTTTFKCLNA